MGNSGSSRSNQDRYIPHSEELKKLYHKVCDYGLLNQDLFNQHFKGPCENVARNLFGTYFVDLLNSSDVTANLFVQRANSILEAELQSNNDQFNLYFDLLNDNSQKSLDKTAVSSLIQSCCQYPICVEQENDIKENDLVIKGLTASCIATKNSISKQEFIQWVQETCPLIFSGFQSWLHYTFTGKILKNNLEILPFPFESQSNTKILSFPLLWLLCSILPSCYLKLENKYKIKDDEDAVDDSVKYTWNLLYESNEHGLSLNRFKNKVMSYKSPTLMFIQLEDGRLLLIAVDQPWKDSAERYGGPYCNLIEIYPTMQIIEADANMIYLKESSRAILTGLIIGSSSTKPKVIIDTDLSTVKLNYKPVPEDHAIEKIEVWGCGGVEAIASQTDLKKWEKKEVEKRRKVKLPGQWDTDKTILEMGGVTVSHNQRADI